MLGGQILHDPQLEEHDIDMLIGYPPMSMLMREMRDAGFRPFADMPFSRPALNQDYGPLFGREG